MDKKKNVDVAFGNNGSLDIDKIITFLCEIYEIPRPLYSVGKSVDAPCFTAPNVLAFKKQAIDIDERDKWLDDVFHEFAHYLFYWTTRFRYLEIDGRYEWNRLERCLNKHHTLTHPVHSGEEAFAEAFASALFESFKELKPEYKEMFGLKVEY